MATQAVRKKFQQLKRGQVDFDLEAEKTWRPLVTPLKEIVAEKQVTVKNEVKPEWKNEPELQDVEFDYDQDYMVDWGEAKRTPAVGPNRNVAASVTETPFRGANASGVDDEFVYSPKASTSNQLLGESEIEKYYSDFKTFHGDLAAKYVGMIAQHPDLHDTTFGVTLSPEIDKFLLGRKEINFDSANNLHLEGGNIWKNSEGLMELLFLNKPDKNKITSRDESVYKKLLELTGAHKVNFEIDNRNKSSKSFKYKNFISKLFPPAEPKTSRNARRRRSQSVRNSTRAASTSNKKTGRGFIQNTDKSQTLIYFDDPNELISRLELLRAAKDAGNNSLDQEIFSILEELRELKIIY